ncbi:MAG: hypothetical protein KDM91_22255, partial [Verrucomicrobiae bacterium]|nr:hypothetical protein [Verrucomicrobiae bacterium]
HGAGGYDTGTGLADATQNADINVVLTGSLIMQAGGRGNSYVQIGHGGAEASADNRTFRDATLTNLQNNQVSRLWSYNGASSDRAATAIGRLGAVRGNINVLAGVDPTTVQVDFDSNQGVTGATTGPGIILMRGWQELRSANAPDAQEGEISLTPDALVTPAALAAAATYATTTNIQFNNNTESYVQIGHLGTGQFGEVYGDINVSAGGDITLLAGSQSRDHATIGHTVSTFNYWDPTDNSAAQIRFFRDLDAFDNPNFRRGELFNPAMAADTSLALFNPGTIPSNSTVTQRQVGVTAGGPVVVEALDGSVIKDIHGNVTVDSWGANGITIRAYSTPDLRDGIPDGTNDPLTGSLTLNFDDISGDGLWGRYDSNGDTFIDASDAFEPVDNDADGDGIADFGGTNGNDGSGNGEADGVESVFDRRFAGIGNGGSSAEVGTEHNGYNMGPTGVTTRGSELVQLRIRDSIDGANPLDSGSGYFVGEVDSAVNRTATFLNLFGDVTVNAHNGGVSITSGNGQLDHAYIGNVGSYLADYETSNIIAGNVTVTGAKDLVMLSGAPVLGDLDHAIAMTGRAAVNSRNFTMIGNGGIRSGHQYLIGDITVDFGGNITLKGGGYENDFSMIGHGGFAENSQVGGNFNRVEQYFRDYANTLITAGFDYSTGTATIGYASADGGINGTSTWTGTAKSSNISVSAGNDLIMDHYLPGERDTWNIMLFNNGGDVPTDGAYTLIGHGGRDVDALRRISLPYEYDDKIGDIAVSVGRDLDMRNGQEEEMWTAIGHRGSDDTDRVDTTATFAQNPQATAMILAGNITVDVGRDVFMDNSWVPEIRAKDPIHGTLASGRPVFDIPQTGDQDSVGTVFTNLNSDATPDTAGIFIAKQATKNAVVIGHGAVSNAVDIVTVDDGATVNGVSGLESDIMVTVGRDLMMGHLGRKGSSVATTWIEDDPSTPGVNEAAIISIGYGAGYEGGHVQIGHGFASDLANDRARLQNVATGFSGDIMVQVGRDLTMIASPNTFIPGSGADPEMPEGGISRALSGITAQTVMPGTLKLAAGETPLRFVRGAAVVIGNGGHFLDSPADGDINVYVGGDLTMTAQQRQGSEIGFAAFDQFDDIYLTGTTSLRIDPTTSTFTLPAIGDMVNFGSDPTIYTITGISGNTITIDMPLAQDINDRDVVTIVTGGGSSNLVVNAQGQNNVALGQRFIDSDDNEIPDVVASGNIVKIGHWSFEEEDGDGNNTNAAATHRPVIEITSHNTATNLGIG